MNYTILTESEFFDCINAPKDSDMQSAYEKFVEKIIRLCEDPARIHCIYVVLTYTETELEHTLSSVSTIEETARYVRKALSFVRKMLRPITTAVQPGSMPKGKGKSGGGISWTGTLVEFVELLYGLQETGSIDDGKIPIYELSVSVGQLLGVDVKETVFYNTYANIKHRKGNDSRTYFIDKMSERLNLRMQRDDERELRRR